LRWQGVTISTESGKNVQAISAGKVVFADWFSDMGLLIIIDHGDSCMSLYGHWASEEENIAKVGDTDGQEETNLYFEIRYSGDSINPESGVNIETTRILQIVSNVFKAACCTVNSDTSCLNELVFLA